MSLECFYKYSCQQDSLPNIFDNVKLFDKMDNEYIAKDVLRGIRYLALMFVGYENLQERYKKLTEKMSIILKQAHSMNLKLEVIYVPIDIEDVYVQQHKHEHNNWYRIKFEDDYVRLLIERYQIIINPSVVVLSKEGEIISRDGVEDILKDGINVLVTWT